MKLITALQTQNPSYKAARKITPVGILVHSTGSVNRNIKRYVDAPAQLGTNANGNHWNKSTATKSMHAFVGYDINQDVIVAQTLPYHYACWGCGKGDKGSYNRDPVAHLQFEICQSSDTDSAYYWRAMAVSAEYCAYLCRQFGFTAANIVSHKEGHRQGYASNHGDPESWQKHFGDDMHKFRARVQVLLDGGELPEMGGGTDGGEHGPASTHDTIRKGASGPQVVEMQGLLLRHGFRLGSYGADGKFGAVTRQALMDFQTAVGLVADGICGPLTWAELLRIAGDDGAEPEDGDMSVDTYIVIVSGLDEATALLLCESYPGAEMKIKTPAEVKE